MKTKKIILLIVGITFLTCTITTGLLFTFYIKTLPDYAKKIDLIEEQFALIEQNKVTYFQSQDRCKTLEYVKGNFSWNEREESVSQDDCKWDIGFAWNSRNPKLINYNGFSTEEDQIFNKLKDNFGEIGINTFSIKFDKDNKIDKASFGINCFFCRTTLYYSKTSFQTLPKEIPGDTYYYKINEHWFREESDWN